MKVKKSIFTVLVIVIFFVFYTCTQVQAQMTKNEFGDLMEKVEKKLPKKPPWNWNIEGWGYFPESEGVALVVMDIHKWSALGFLNPLFENLNKADIIDSCIVEQINVDKKKFKQRKDNNLFLFLGNSNLKLISGEKKSLKKKSEYLIKTIRKYLKDGTHVEQLPELYYDLMRNSEDRTKYYVKILGRKETWDNGKICIPIIGTGHLGGTEDTVSMIKFLEDARISYIFLFNEKIYIASKQLLKSLKESCLRN